VSWTARGGGSLVKHVLLVGDFCSETTKIEEGDLSALGETSSSVCGILAQREIYGHVRQRVPYRKGVGSHLFLGGEKERPRGVS